MNNPHRNKVRLFAVEKLTLFYLFISTLLLVAIKPELNSLIELLTNRLIILFIMGTMIGISWVKDSWIIRFIRNIYIVGLLLFWYPETYDINRILPNYDHLLANWEQWIFGFQPALAFSKKFSQLWISEILNMGYFAYYPLIVCTGIYFYFTNVKHFQHYFFTVLFAFFTYYLFFILFPSTGPQYYFAAIGDSNMQSGVFPNVGTYFNTHSQLLPTQTHGGFFENLVEGSQTVGERPTAAFPSSHVGISTLILILILRSHRKKLFFVVIPFYTTLVLSTVYIQAHYVIDVIAGFVSAVLLYYASKPVYRWFNRSSITYKPISDLRLPFITTMKQKRLSTKRQLHEEKN